MDVSLLRHALRLVHCLQKERGASCAVCASDDEGFRAALQSARGDTDRAASRLYWHMPPALDRIRSQIGSSAQGVHRMLVIFNTLISNVVHEYILQYLQQSHVRRRGYRRQRSNTADGILFAHDSSQSHRYQSDNLVPEFLLPHAIVPSNTSAVFVKPMSDPFVFMRHQSPPKHVCTPPATRSIHSTERKKQISSNFLDTQQDRTDSLVNLLGCLVRLKESTGMQRAVISSMMGPDSQMLVTTLILEVENQRKLVAELQHLPLFDYSLQKLVQDSIQMGPQMETLQAKILNDFDLPGLHDEMNSNDIWNMITVYIDKLHALELLLVEELEYCVEQHVRDTTSAVTKKDEQVLLQCIFGENAKDMPAEEIKKKLVECMEQDSAQQEADPPPPFLRDALQLPRAESTKEWHISLDELQFKRRIGQGTAGTTYLAKWSGQTVAVKVAAFTEMGLEGWKTEVQSLQRLHHPNVIRLLGSVYNENPLTYCLVLEFCNAGDLADALQLPTPNNFFFSVAGDIASGLGYLHRRGVLHRDIKPSNVLLDGRVRDGVFRAKLSDFGLSTSFEGDSDKTPETGTYRWMAPEIIRHELYSIEADVYSYAILCWQLITREVPFGDVSPLEAAGKVALELARPPFPAGTPLGIRELISACWSEEPSQRLLMADVSTRLVELEEKSILTPEEAAWLHAPFGHAVYQTKIKKSSSLAPLQVPNPPKLEAKQEKWGHGLRAIFAHRAKQQGH